MMTENGAALAGAEGFRPGEVWLASGGAGDALLLEPRVVAGLRQADLVLHDALPADAVRRLARPGVRLLDVGRRQGAAATPPAEVIACMIAAARAGQRVLRLQGAGRPGYRQGGEEGRALSRAGIRWQAVPGTGAGAPVPAAPGPAAQADAGDPAWASLVRGGGSITGFMALPRLEELALRLLAAGQPATMPVVLVARASQPGRAILRSTLGRCSLDARRAALPSPVLAVIGEVAGLEAVLPPTAAGEGVPPPPANP